MFFRLPSSMFACPSKSETMFKYEYLKKKTVKDKHLKLSLMSLIIKRIRICKLGQRHQKCILYVVVFNGNAK